MLNSLGTEDLFPSIKTGGTSPGPPPLSFPAFKDPRNAGDPEKRFCRTGPSGWHGFTSALSRVFWISAAQPGVSKTRLSEDAKPCHPDRISGLFLRQGKKEWGSGGEAPGSCRGRRSFAKPNATNEVNVEGAMSE